ncbi:hypothetical protein [Paenibacillus tianjinensis]|uniref:Uncharacterized protein n=1 Tax=Paenibacillus tianjinensis TaxID=2810347 RepID=A0ABX7LAJ5_9BACL|nr:hypothetical protein [Paenibacillus tianjinensis]QSF43465.1 hypothetical protein JRJ22_19570 [Paenibacillus tianjinensis]
MADYKITPNKKHGGKQFKNSFRFIGKVSQVSKKDESDSWIKQPIAKQYTTQSGKQRRLIQFEIETALSNRLRVELSGMEQKFAYPYSSTHKKSVTVDWADRNNKDKFPDNTYHPIEVDWDKCERLGKMIKADEWYEVRGNYSFEEFTKDDGSTTLFVKRNINSARPIVNGQIQQEDGTFQTVKHAGEEFDYVTDFSSPLFREVNYFSMQTGIRSTYQNEETKDTKVNGVFLDYGKERSEPKDVELIVYQTEVPEGKKSLADAFASLNTNDFIEVTGQDNNRATFAYVEVTEEIDSSDPFADVDDTQRVVRKERVTNGDKKGLEITGYVANSLMRDLLTEEEVKKTVAVTNDNPFGSNSTATDNPFGDDPFSSTKSSDPFSDDPFK